MLALFSDLWDIVIICTENSCHFAHIQSAVLSFFFVSDSFIRCNSPVFFVFDRYLVVDLLICDPSHRILVQARSLHLSTVWRLDIRTLNSHQQTCLIYFHSFCGLLKLLYDLIIISSLIHSLEVIFYSQPFNSHTLHSCVTARNEIRSLRLLMIWRLNILSRIVKAYKMLIDLSFSLSLAGEWIANGV